VVVQISLMFTLFALTRTKKVKGRVVGGSHFRSWHTVNFASALSRDECGSFTSRVGNEGYCR